MRTPTFYGGPTPEDLARIPPVLTTVPQWILWRWEDLIDSTTGEIKANKTPINPLTLGHASSTNARTWATFTHCVATLEPTLARWGHMVPAGYHGGGLGFVFTPEDPYVGIDLDQCRNPETGMIEPWAHEMIAALATYTEVSPSGCGVKLWTKGHLPAHGRKTGSVEMYSAGRYFTVTGHHLGGTPRFITERQDALTAAHRATFGPPPAPTRVAPVPSTAACLDDSRLLAKARIAKNGAKFAALWSGDISGYPSRSNADLAFCDLLVFWTTDVAQLDRLFRQSGLMRDKWDERHGVQTYGAMTIGKALRLQTEHYQLRPVEPPHAPRTYHERMCARIRSFEEATEPPGPDHLPYADRVSARIRSSL
jgi:primase-polymerase (primpol)-like protein